MTPDHIVYYDCYDSYGQSFWSVSGFNSQAEAEQYCFDTEMRLYGYSPSCKILQEESKIIVKVSCWNSCD